MPKPWLILALLACASVVSTTSAADKLAAERLVVFGDSLSDPGNAFALLGTNNTPPDWSVDAFLVPDRPYAKGGHHLSNGATWIEQLARPLGLARSVRPALRGGGATNYAFSGCASPGRGNPFIDQRADHAALCCRGARVTHDVYAKLNTIVANPQLFGLSNVTSACITPSTPPFSCKKPDEYLFWDGIQPTKAAHGVLAEEAARTLLP